MATKGSKVTANTALVESDDEDDVDSPMWVAAIDFGTTYSGYAFSSKSDYKKQKDKIYTSQWTQTANLITGKTPTTLLLDPNGKFVAFGADAETQYAALAQDNGHMGWRYFKHFKMLLHNRKVKIYIQS